MKLLVLLGFCLVAAISSTAFIRTLSDRILTEARQARRDAAEAKGDAAEVKEAVQPLMVKETEQDETADGSNKAGSSRNE